jgi:hypothetical protein
MGGFTGPRNHSQNVVPRAFMRRLPQRARSFHALIPDAMQDVVGAVRHNPAPVLDSEAVVRHFLDLLNSYQYSQDYTVEQAIILLLDTPEYVPTIKAATQRKRDGGGEEKKTTQPSRIMTQELYEQYESQMRNHLLIHEESQLEIDRTAVWRSTARRNEIYRLYGNALARDAHVRDGLVVMLDDALAIDEDRYCEVRSQMLGDYDFYARPAYEQECLAAYLTRHHMTQRLFKYPDGAFVRRAATCIGEADLKVCWYIDMAIYQRYLIVSQDTDLIWILLLHCKRLLNAEGRLPDELELWIDSQTPKDARKGRSRPYRFIDVKALYNGIVELFAREYPSVQHPIETYLFLFDIVKTDYTKPFDTSLEITWAVVWNTFSELHSASPLGHLLYLGECYDEEKPLSKPVTVKRERRRFLPRELRGLLNECVLMRYDPHTDAHQLALDEVAVQRFLYLLCELKVRRDLVAIGHSEYDNELDNRYIIDTDELFMKIALLEDNVAQCRAGVQSPAQLKQRVDDDRWSMFRAALDEVKAANTEFKAMPLDEQWAVPVLAPSQKDTLDMDAIPMPGATKRRARAQSSASVQHLAQVTDLSKKTRPPQWGVPSLQRMLGHIYRLEFVMNYHQNGWLAPEFALSFAEGDERQPALSKHGWRQREVPQTAETVARGDFNCVYYATEFAHGPPRPGVLPFRLYETTECDEVYCRRHEYYAATQQQLK